MISNISNQSFNPNRLRLCYYNDTHGNSDLIAGMASEIKNFKNNSLNKDCVSFVLSGGDNCSGGDVKKNNFIFDLMQNYMGVDVSAVGNHETDALANGFSDAAKDKKVDFVATNVKFSQDNPMNDFVKKSVIKEQNGVKVGFIGAMPIDFKSCTKEASQKGIEVSDFDDTIEELQQEIDKLQKQDVNKIIMVSHSGYDTDKELAKNLSGVDVIIGGHSHTVVQDAKNGQNVVQSKTNEPVLITQGGENAKYYGIAELEFDDKGVIKKVSNNLLESTNRQKSPVIEYIKDEHLGKSPQIGKISKIDPLPENRKVEPCTWTAVMADSIRDELGVDIAIINSANIRKVPQIGILTQRDVSESAPMKNNLIRTKITQKQLVEAVKNAAKSTMTTNHPGLIQGSGFSYKITDKGDLIEFNIVSKDNKITPVDINNPSDEIIYSAAYDSFVAQKDGETPELAPKFEVEHFDYDKDKTMIDYLSKREDKDNLEFNYDNRIEIQKTSQPISQSNNNQKFLSLTSLKAS